MEAGWDIIFIAAGNSRRAVYVDVVLQTSTTGKLQNFYHSYHERESKGALNDITSVEAIKITV
jgi:hypothetical protein